MFLENCDYCIVTGSQYGNVLFHAAKKYIFKYNKFIICMSIVWLLIINLYILYNYYGICVINNYTYYTYHICVINNYTIIVLWNVNLFGNVNSFD